MPFAIGKCREKEEKGLSRVEFLCRCRFRSKDAGNPLKLPRVTATGLRATTTWKWDEIGDERNRDQPKSLSFPINSARSKLAKAHPEFAVQNSSGFSERFVHSSLDLENYVLRLLYWENSGSCRRAGQDWLTTREEWLHAKERQMDDRCTWVCSHGSLPWEIWLMRQLLKIDYCISPIVECSVKRWHAQTQTCSPRLLSCLCFLMGTWLTVQVPLRTHHHRML